MIRVPAGLLYYDGPSWSMGTSECCFFTVFEKTQNKMDTKFLIRYTYCVPRLPAAIETVEKLKKFVNRFYLNRVPKWCIVQTDEDIRFLLSLNMFSVHTHHNIIANTCNSHFPCFIFISFFCVDRFTDNLTSRKRCTRTNYVRVNCI